MSLVANLVAGVAAGVGICAVGHPFDTIKVLQQMEPGRFPGVVAAARDTIAKHGPLGLYRGVAAPLVGSGFYNAVQFATYSRIKSAFTNGGRDNSLNRIGAAAAVTGVFVALVEGPQDLVKSQMQATMRSSSSGAARPQYKSTADCAATLLRARGLPAFAQGLDATIARNIIGAAALEEL